MLVLRQEQMEAFRQHRSRMRLRELAAFVRRGEPRLVEGWSDGELERGLQEAGRRASAFGISDSLAVGEYFVAMAMYSASFDTYPAALAILRDDTQHPDRRIHAVWRSMTRQDWAEVRATCAPPWRQQEQAPC